MDLSLSPYLNVRVFKGGASPCLHSSIYHLHPPQSSNNSLTHPPMLPFLQKAMADLPLDKGESTAQCLEHQPSSEGCFRLRILGSKVHLLTLRLRTMWHSAAKDPPVLPSCENAGNYNSKGTGRIEAAAKQQQPRLMERCRRFTLVARSHDDAY
jgi:hypothetical protein